MAEPLPTSNLAPMYGDYVGDYLGKTQALTGTEYQPYTGDMFAGPSSLQQQAFSGIGGLAMPQYYGQAGNMYGQAAGMYGSNMYNPTNFSSSQVTPQMLGMGLDASDSGIMQGFMNPYTQQVTDIAKREAQRGFDVSQAGRDASAAKAGAFGGSRHGLVDAEAQRSLDRQLSDIQMQGGESAYRAAMEALNQQRASQQQAGMANQAAGLDAGKFNANQGLMAQLYGDQSRQFGANFGNQRAQGLSGIAGGLGSLGNSQFGAQQGMYDQMMRAGATQQGFSQQPLDFGYQQWQQSQQFPYQQLQFQRDMLQGLPLSVAPSTQTNPMLEGLMGAGGIYNLLFGGD